MTKNEKIIYSDVDEVVVKWLPAFSEKAKALGYKVIDPTLYFLHHHFDIPEDIVEELYLDFNSSENFANLHPIDDSIIYARKIAEDFGYKFCLISACGESQQGQAIYDNRFKNVSSILGEENIHSLYCTPSSAAKREVLILNRDKGHIWVDDNISNVELGEELGYESILYTSPYNKHYKVEPPMKRVDSWREIYNRIKELEKGGF